MQIKTEVRYHYIHFGMANIKTGNNQVFASLDSNWNFYVTNGNVKWNNFGKQLESLIKLNIYLLYDVAIPHIRIYAREMNAYDHTETCV